MVTSMTLKIREREIGLKNQADRSMYYISSQDFYNKKLEVNSHLPVRKWARSCYRMERAAGSQQSESVAQLVISASEAVHFIVHRLSKHVENLNSFCLGNDTFIIRT